MCVHVCAHVCVYVYTNFGCCSSGSSTYSVSWAMFFHWPDVHHIGYIGWSDHWGPGICPSLLPGSGVTPRLSLVLLPTCFASPSFPKVCFASPKLRFSCWRDKDFTESSLQSHLSHFSFASCFLSLGALFFGSLPVGFCSAFNFQLKCNRLMGLPVIFQPKVTSSIFSCFEPFRILYIVEMIIYNHLPICWFIY